MTSRIVLAIPDPAIVREVTDLAREDSGLEIVATASDATRISAVVGRETVEAVILHEDLGPLPAMDIARDLTRRFPHVGVVLLAREATPDLLRAALQAGVRDVLAPPLSLESLQTGVRQAASWAQAVQQRLSPDAEGEIPAGDQLMVAVAGAKGGVGTTTVAIQLALAVVRAGPSHSVCLVDLDLQTGDVRSFFDLPRRRSIGDLIGLRGDVAGQVEEAIYRHESGLHVLLGPEDGESAEEVEATLARSILGAAKLRHDVTVVDAGSVVTDASAVAVELADSVLVVATPDVPAMRGANRLTGFWQRLQVRGETGVSVLLNRVSRDSEIQPELAARALAAPIAETTVSASFRDLEEAINTGNPGRAGDGGMRKAFDALAVEVGAVAPPRRRRSLLRSQAGQVTVEFVGLLATILFVILLLWQIALVGYSFVLADHAAREGARALAVGEDVKAAVRSDLPGAWRRNFRVRERDDEKDSAVKVSVAVPLLVPGFRTPFRVPAEEGTVREGEPLPESQE
jgi:pilus assembly protein CpaE